MVPYRDVEQAITIHICNRRTGHQVLITDRRPGKDGAVRQAEGLAFRNEELVRPGNEDVLATVAREVGHRHPKAHEALWKARRGRRVREDEIAIVVQQDAAALICGDEQVEQSIEVIVQDRCRAPGQLGG